MIKDVQNFVLDLKHFYDVVVPQNHLEFQKRIAIRLHQLIVFKNSQMNNHPVDTGWARANWTADWKATMFARPPTTPLGIKGSFTSIQNIMTSLGGIKPFGVIWIYNNVPYIEKLEDGWSKQAPVGMVSGALTDLQGFIDKL